MAKNKLGDELLDACAKGDRVVAQQLLAKGAPINHCAESGMTPLLAAVQRGFDEIIELLIHHGAQVNKLKQWDDWPLLRAVRSDHVETVKLLVSHGADPQKKDPTTNKTLLFASRIEQMTRYLVAAGVDVNSRNREQSTALHEAARWGKYQVASVLIEHGADVNAVGEYGDTPIFEASGSSCLSSPSMIKLLLTSGAEIDRQGKYNGAPLHWACYCGKLEAVKVLVEHKASLEARIAYHAGTTPLHVAAQKGEAAIVQYLLDHGADLTAETTEGRTSLHIAAQQGHFGVIQLLMERGADLDAEDADGLRPLDLAANFKVRQLFSADRVWSAWVNRSQEIATDLEQMGYFKYAQAAHLNELRAKLMDAYLEHGILSVAAKRKSAKHSLDLRRWLCDAQDLAEGSLGKSLLEWRELFAKLGVSPIQCQDQLTDRDYHVVINGRDFLVYDAASLRGSDSWTISYVRFIEIANALLEEAGSPERVYAQPYRGHATSVLVLTDVLFDYICALEIDDEWMPTSSTADLHVNDVVDVLVW